MKFRYLDDTGDTCVEYNMTVKEEAELAVKQFEELINSGMQVIGIEEGGEKFMSATFEPETAEYIIGLPLAGG